jgi:hypothetical protein
MRFFEIFSTPYHWIWTTKHRDDHYVAEFRSEKYVYGFTASLSDDDIWMINFWMTDDTGKDTENLTRTGDQYKVFSTITDILKSLISIQPMYGITFTAEEPSRQKLYNRMITQLLPTWKLESHGSEVYAINPNYKPDSN